MRIGPPAPFAEFGFGDDEATQLLGRNEKRFDISFGTRVDERRPPRQLSDFGKELARSFFDNRDHMAQTVPRADRHGPGDEDEHAGARLARDQ